tara:strand:+ start:1805 stop:1942 length:138 start_codon:yes stop_codon:yes gene_type:complete
MKKEIEVKVTIKDNGHIFYKGKLIALLAAWNKYDDLDLPTKRREK